MSCVVLSFSVIFTDHRDRMSVGFITTYAISAFSH